MPTRERIGLLTDVGVTNGGKATFMLRVQPCLTRSARAVLLRQRQEAVNRPRLNRLLVSSLDTRLMEFPVGYGTCIHHGGGLFSTALHCLKVDLGVYHDKADLILKITAIWGAGELLGPGVMLRYREFELDVLCVPAFVDRFPCHANRMLTPLLGRRQMLPDYNAHQDLAFLRLKDGSSHDNFKWHRKLLPHVSAELAQRPTVASVPFDISLFAVNSEADPEQYYRNYIANAVMTVHPSQEAVCRILSDMKPRQITISRGQAAKTPTLERLEREIDYRFMLRHTSACLQGSSGGAVVDAQYRQIATHVATEKGLDVAENSYQTLPELRSIAVLWNSPTIVAMIRDKVLPAFAVGKLRQDVETITALEAIIEFAEEGH